MGDPSAAHAALQDGACLNEQLCGYDSKMSPPLLCATTAESMEWLLLHGADPNCSHVYGCRAALGSIYYTRIHHGVTLQGGNRSAVFDQTVSSLLLDFGALATYDHHGSLRHRVRT